MSPESRFQISVPEDALALLHRKLADANFPDEVSDAGWDYGVPLSDVKRLVNKWKGGYDWQAHERELNTVMDVVKWKVRSRCSSSMDVLKLVNLSPSFLVCGTTRRAWQLHRGDTNAAALDLNWG
jgi:hypothetical protein